MIVSFLFQAVYTLKMARVAIVFKLLLIVQIDLVIPLSEESGYYTVIPSPESDDPCNETAHSLTVC